MICSASFALANVPGSTWYMRFVHCTNQPTIYIHIHIYTWGYCSRVQTFVYYVASIVTQSSLYTHSTFLIFYQRKNSCTPHRPLFVHYLFLPIRCRAMLQIFANAAQTWLDNLHALFSFFIVLSRWVCSVDVTYLAPSVTEYWPMHNPHAKVPWRSVGLCALATIQ